MFQPIMWKHRLYLPLPPTHPHSQPSPSVRPSVLSYLQHGSASPCLLDLSQCSPQSTRWVCLLFPVLCIVIINIWKCNFPMTPPARPSVGGRSVCHKFVKGWAVPLPCSCRSACFFFCFILYIYLLLSYFHNFSRRIFFPFVLVWLILNFAMLNKK